MGKTKEYSKAKVGMRMTYVIRGLCKSYNGNPVFSDVNLTLEEGKVYCLMAPSGAGKTTLLRILMGLERADAGTVTGMTGRRIGAVFQEDRLCPGLGAVKNVMFTDPSCTEEQVRRQLLSLLPEEALGKPVCEYSGGMRRRVSLVRAMAGRGEILLFDEPFNGLDEETRQIAMDYVKKERNGRTLIFATHHKEEGKALGACPVLWDEQKKTWNHLASPVCAS